MKSREDIEKEKSKIKQYDCKICTNKFKDNGHWCMDICKGDEFEVDNEI